MDHYGSWSTCTVIKKESELNNPLPMLKVGFRRYNPMGDQVDDLGVYFGKGENYDLSIALYSIRIQKPHSTANNADPYQKIVWKFQPIS